MLKFLGGIIKKKKKKEKKEGCFKDKKTSQKITKAIIKRGHLSRYI